MFSSHHLTITTPHKVHTWDLQGLHTIFASSRGGICAAKESGNGILAVADKHVVVLHDCRRGREKSWGLGADEGQVRLLEYAPNAKSLFLGTSISGSVQCYSIHEEKLLRPAHPHPSPPTVFAVSPSTHLLLSASENPTVVYLQNLSLNTRAHQLHPAASDAPVVAAAFHPDRHDVFLLAFKDGTLAAYDATKTPVRTGHGRERQVGDTDTRGREIARFRNLHRVTNVGTTDRGGVLLAAAPGGYDRESRTVAVGARSVGITSAAFLPGYHTRAISVGGDGRCRLVDFGGGGAILRTWHAQAPVTALSVLRVQEHDFNSSIPDRTVNDHKRNRGSINNHYKRPREVIAVGRADGRVVLFDSVGLKLDEIVVDPDGGRVISLDWAHGASPKPLSSEPVLSVVQEEETQPRQRRKRFVAKDAGREEVPSMTNALPVVDYGTVQQSPAKKLSFPPEGAFPPPSANYLDLFSPVKQVEPPISPPPRSARHRGNTAKRAPSRPRLSSKTFTGFQTAGEQSPTVRPPISPTNPPVFPAEHGTASSSPTPRPTPQLPARSPRRPSATGSATSAMRRRKVRTSPRKTPPPLVETNAGFDGSSAPNVVRNGQILADLRRMSAKEGNLGGRRKSTGLAFFAPYLKSTKTAEGNDDPNYVSYPVSVHDVDDRMANSATHAVLTPREESKSTTEQSLSASSNGLGDDIWVTSDSDHESRTQKRRLKKRPLPRPVAAVSSTTMSLPAHLTGDFPESSTSLSAATSDTPTLTSPDVTTTDVFEPVRFRHPTFADAGAAQSTANTGAYDTARTHLEEAVDCTPEPEDIQTLLPRSSSFEPTRETRVTHAPLLERNEEVVGAKQRDGGGKRAALTGLALNAVQGRPSFRLPRKRTRVRKDGSVRVVEDAGELHPQTLENNGEARAGHGPEAFVGKAEAGAGVVSGLRDEIRECREENRRLKSEMAQMRAEMLAMKAALRRAGR